MDDSIAYIILIIALILSLSLIVLYLQKRRIARILCELEIEIADLRSRKQSLSTKYGKMTEMFFPLLETYPYDHNNFRFIGSPIDGIQFEDDRVILVEFKIGESQLSTKQRRIRKMVAEKRVQFEEHRIPPAE